MFSEHPLIRRASTPFFALLCFAISIAASADEAMLPFKLKVASRPIPEDLNLSPKLVGKHFTVSYRPKPEAKVVLNKMHSWSIQVAKQTVSSSPLVLSLDGGMPRHMHGFPSAPRVFPGEQPGSFLIRGMKFHMPGWWVVELTVQEKDSDLRERFVFNLIL